MFKKLCLTVVAVCFMTQNAFASDQVRAAGSSTVYPFITVIAEEFGRTTDFKTPIIESTGTGGGFKLFCSGFGSGTTDISNASRAIKDGERQMCKNNGIDAILEIKLGYDGIVLANSLEGIAFDLTKEQIFNAIARQVVIDGQLVDNPNTKWSDIASNLPDTKIEVYGPPPTSGTRDAFVELVMLEACIGMEAFDAAYSDKTAHHRACKMIREDGVFIEAGENDNLIVQKLRSNEDALGIFGFSFLDQNTAAVKGSKINGVAPNFDNIADGSYGVSRPLYVYVKKAHFNKTAGLQEFVKEMVSDKAIGEDGYLVEKGLIPLSEEELTAMRQEIML